MQSALLEFEPSSSEQLWIVNWQLIGNGDLFNELQRGNAATELLDTVDRGVTAGGSVRRVDRIRFRRRLAQHTDDFTQRVCEWIEREESNSATEILQQLHDHRGRTWLEAVNHSLPLVAVARARDAAAASGAGTVDAVCTDRDAVGAGDTMKITQMHIEHFAGWRDTTLDLPPEDMHVLYGPNETGKSTLLRFLRGVLYGFTECDRDFPGCAGSEVHLRRAPLCDAWRP